MSGESPRVVRTSFAVLLVCAACAGEPFRAATETAGGAGATSSGSGAGGELLGGAAGSSGANGGAEAVAGMGGGTAGGATGGGTDGGATDGGAAAGAADGGAATVGMAGDSAGAGIAGSPSVGGTSGGAPAAGRGGASGSPGNGKAVEVQVSIATDQDDAVWVNGSEERLKYSDTSPDIEVGNDSERCRAGLRFALPVPKGATIVMSTLRLSRTDGTVGANATMGVQVYDSVTVAPFHDDVDTHSAEFHDPAGLFPRFISGFRVGNVDSTTDSPNLAELVQYLVDRPDYVHGATIGFVLSPDTLDGWVMFADSSSGGGQATLRVTYRPR